jgi:hypothetical protein
MPGTFTHFMVAEAALARVQSAFQAGSLATTLARRKCFVFQGSISPDYPFIAERLPAGLRTAGNWGARMHSENTGAVVDAGLKLLELRTGDEREICLAWLFGYASHLVADAVVHPVVNLAVGGVAPFTETRHGECEIAQDTWIFAHVKKRELVDGSAEYVRYLGDCSDAKDPDCVNAHIHRFWRDCLKGAHPVSGATEQEFALAYASIAPHAWHRALLALLPIAARPGVMLRYIGSVVHLRERMYDRLTSIPAENMARYVENLDVPNGSSGNTKPAAFEAVFRTAVEGVVEVWQRMAQDLAALEKDRGFEPQPYPNWDLDTGVEMPTWGPTYRSRLDRLALWR